MNLTVDKEVKHFELLDSWRVNTSKDCYTSLLDNIVSLIEEAENKVQANLTVGIGMPGIVTADNKVVSANVSCANGNDIKHDLTKKLNREIAIENDCRLFALSEANGGCADKAKVTYGAVIGTGAGGGLCIDKKLLSTTNNLAGEYGHLPLPAHLIQKHNLPLVECGCGLIGCAETYIAGPGLALLYQTFSGKAATAEEIVELAVQQDPYAVKTFECFIELLASSMVTLILSYDPDVIALGGGLSKITLIYEQLPSAVSSLLLKGVKVPAILPAHFGDSSGVRGAAIIGAKVNEQ